MFLKNLISSRDGPVKSIETKQRWKYARKLLYFWNIGRKERQEDDKKITPYLVYAFLLFHRFEPGYTYIVFLRVFMPALILYFLKVHP